MEVVAVAGAVKLGNSVLDVLKSLEVRYANAQKVKAEQLEIKVILSRINENFRAKLDFVGQVSGATQLVQPVLSIVGRL